MLVQGSDGLVVAVDQSKPPAAQAPIEPLPAWVGSRADTWHGTIEIVARPHAQTDASFLKELPRLLEERAMSAHALAKKAGVNHSHLSRANRGKDYKSLSGALVARLGHALELPTGYFPEEREAVVIEEIRKNATLRDELYRGLNVSGEKPLRSTVEEVDRT